MVSVLLFSVFLFGWVSTEVTHMPILEEPTLPPDVVKAIEKGEKLIDEDCQLDTKDNLERLLSRIQFEETRKSDGFHVKTPKPCFSCYHVRNGNSRFTLNITNYTLHRMYEQSVVVDVTFVISNIQLECDVCRFTDDDGNQHVGNVVAIYSNAICNVIAENVDENTSSGTILYLGKIVSANFTNDDAKHVHVTCKGNDKFVEVCKNADNYGELEHVGHAIVEQLFTYGVKMPDSDFSLLALTLRETFTCLD